MRFTRFFNNTPMAIASVDGDGRILRTNAPFLKLFSGVVSRDDIEHGALSKPSSRKAIGRGCDEALAAAKDRQGDIAPIDSRIRPTKRGISASTSMPSSTRATRRRKRRRSSMPSR